MEGLRKGHSMPAAKTSPEEPVALLRTGSMRNEWKSNRPNHLVHYHWPKAKKTPNRLINIDSLEIEEFPSKAPPYAILSHRWSGDELHFEEYNSPGIKDRAGYQKIARFCDHIRSLNISGEDGKQDYTGPLVEWVWVDTCCIDKRSSAELSEAVNSMAAWYKHAAFCVAYLHDVTAAEDNDWASFRASEWFRRGWTLQELLFPPSVVFCDRDWNQFLWMSMLEREALELVSDISGIPVACLRNSREIFEESIANRLSWAAKRSTTRKEDEAYCLLGLLDINMPLIYGEGERAFTRLQEEIIKQSHDETIFAWTMDANSERLFPVLARSPAQFRDCNVVCRQSGPRKPYSITNQGLELYSEFVRLSNVRLTSTVQNELILIELNCCYQTEHGLEPCLLALARRPDSSVYRRVYPLPTTWNRLVPAAQGGTYEAAQTFHIATDTTNARNPYRGLNKELFDEIPSLRERFESVSFPIRDTMQGPDGKTRIAE